MGRHRTCRFSRCSNSRLPSSGDRAQAADELDDLWEDMVEALKMEEDKQGPQVCVLFASNFLRTVRFCAGVSLELGISNTCSVYDTEAEAT